MRVIGKKIILKLKKKNIGNLRLCDEVDKLITDLEKFVPKEKIFLTLGLMQTMFIVMDFIFLI